MENSESAKHRMLCEPLDGVEMHAHDEQIWRLKLRPSCIAVKLFGSADHIDGTRESSHCDWLCASRSLVTNVVEMVESRTR